MSVAGEMGAGRGLSCAQGFGVAGARRRGSISAS